HWMNWWPLPWISRPSDEGSSLSGSRGDHEVAGGVAAETVAESLECSAGGFESAFAASDRSVKLLL
ncbi:hypothetical protein CRG98_006507, partial [Punica granatum]